MGWCACASGALDAGGEGREEDVFRGAVTGVVVAAVGSGVAVSGTCSVGGLFDGSFCANRRRSCRDIRGDEERGGWRWVGLRGWEGGVFGGGGVGVSVGSWVGDEVFWPHGRDSFWAAPTRIPPSLLGAYPHDRPANTPPMIVRRIRPP